MAQSGHVTAREAAYHALLESLQEKRFIADVLEEWRHQTNPSHQDFQLARQMAYGASQMALTLDYIADQLSEKKKASLKLRERALVRLALYQACFLKGIPLYASANEMVSLAKKKCHFTFANYLNALLRKLKDGSPALPEGNDPKSISIRYSYPIWFVEQLIKANGIEQTKQILIAGNLPAPIMARVRNISRECLPNYLSVIQDNPLMAQFNSLQDFSKVAASPEYYIQNITPAELIYQLSKQLTHKPKRILDLCASPGGKLIAVHDFFPQAQLFANDRTEQKITVLQDNLNKYNISATLTCGEGQQYVSTTPFDIIILDVPCSNSGVLNKRPEARWRLSQDAVTELEKTQLELIAHAKKLLANGGEIWYLTCSILSDENQNLVHRAAKLNNLRVLDEQAVLPNAKGWDGGYAARIA